MSIVKILLCGLTAALVVCLWPDALIYLVSIAAGVLVLAMLCGVIALIDDQPLLAVALLLLWREGGDKS